MRPTLAMLPVLLIIGVPLSVDATTVLSVSLEELVARSAVVLHGTVSTVDNQPPPTARGPFRTRVDFVVHEVVKGLDQNTRSFSIELPGGRGFGLVVGWIGMPRFSVGDEVVLLLEKLPHGGFALTGLSQGVFRVAHGQFVTQVSREMSDVQFVSPQDDLARDIGPPVLLPDLLTLLRDLAVREARP